jgi:hypothetical protein
MLGHVCPEIIALRKVLERDSESALTRSQRDPRWERKNRRQTDPERGSEVRRIEFRMFRRVAGSNRPAPVPHNPCRHRFRGRQLAVVAVLAAIFEDFWRATGTE